MATISDVGISDVRTCGAKLLMKSLSRGEWSTGQKPQAILTTWRPEERSEDVILNAFEGDDDQSD
jgi:hypothetical protein